MQHDLDQRHEGRGQPIKLPVALAACALLVAGCGGDEDAPRRSVLIASGRDDHGLLVQDSVELLEAPEGARAAVVPAGSLVAVLDERGDWTRVRGVASGRHGWVNDYYLRGTAHLVARERCDVRARGGGSFRLNAQVELLRYQRRSGITWVRVRALDGGREAWVRDDALSELPMRRAGCDG